MKPVITTTLRFNSTSDTYSAPEHSLIYVARGSMTIDGDGPHAMRIGEGECVFVRKDHRLRMHSKPSGQRGFHLAVALHFPRRLLMDFYRTMPYGDIPDDIHRSRRSVLKIPTTTRLASLFESFRPFWEAGETPDDTWAMMKVTEGVRIVLDADRNTYASLFDFTSRWRPDIMEFMEENYRYNLSMAEIARLTGRSSSTFKRDFARLSGLTPAAWRTRRRLEEARKRLIGTNAPVGQIMSDLGFGNFAYFSQLYRRTYGVSPSDSRTKASDLQSEA